MKITSQEVKTIYTITFDTVDLLDIITKYQKDEAQKIMFPKAFEGMTVTPEMPESNLIKLMKEISRYGNGDTYKVIAANLGFDGWTHAGLYNETKQIYTMTVFLHGDQINIW